MCEWCPLSVAVLTWRVHGPWTEGAVKMTMPPPSAHPQQQDPYVT